MVPIPCHSPKFWPPGKSTVYKISSSGQPAITLAYVPLPSAMAQGIGSFLSLAPSPAAGKFGSSATTRGLEAQASQTKTNPARQTFLGSRPQILVSLEAVSDSGVS
jgi:hypothetical protein